MPFADAFEPLRRALERAGIRYAIGARLMHGFLSSSSAFIRTVLEVRCRVGQRLLNILRLQFGIVPKKVGPPGIQRHSLYYPAHGKPHPANAWLMVHLVRIPSNAIETLHRLPFSYIACPEPKPQGCSPQRQRVPFTATQSYSFLIG
jgi:hypothetical protein